MLLTTLPPGTAAPNPHAARYAVQPATLALDMARVLSEASTFVGLLQVSEHPLSEAIDTDVGLSWPVLAACAVAAHSTSAIAPPNVRRFPLEKARRA